MRTKDKVVKNIIANLKLTYRETKYKAAHWHRSKMDCMVTWMS